MLYVQRGQHVRRKQIRIVTYFCRNVSAVENLKVNDENTEKLNMLTGGTLLLNSHSPNLETINCLQEKTFLLRQIPRCLKIQDRL